MKNVIYSLSIAVISALIFAGCYSSSPATSSNRYSAPDWAPVYEPGVRYYYLPDIETYYDVSSGNFVYFDGGQWIYSRDLPMVYRGYDLYNGYSVVLDRRVHQPWRYHQNYVSSYPRYYYRSTYGDQNSSRIRGYNENARKPVYLSPSDRARRNSSTSPATPEVNSASGESRTSDYSNRRVDEPVKVTPEMREPRQSGTPSTSSPANSNSQRRQSTSERSGIGSGSEDNVRQRRSSNTAPPPSVRRNDNQSPRPSDTDKDSKSSTEDKPSSRRR